MSETPNETPIIAGPASRSVGAAAPARRRLIPGWLAMTLFAISTLAVFWAFYVDVARLGPGNFGLVVRGDALINVYKPGQIAYKVPLLDRLITLDSSPRPLSSVRMSAPMADGKTAHLEIVVVFRYADPALVWQAWRADQQRVRDGLDADLRRQVRESMRVLAAAEFAADSDRRAWTEALHKSLTERWAGYGIVPTEMRLVQSRIADGPRKK